MHHGAADSPDSPSTIAPEQRHIRSFVRRRGHISDAQKRHFEETLPKWGIAYEKKALDLHAVFGRSAPCWLEIGFGMGETTARIATENAHVNYLGVEVFTAGVGSLLKKIEEQGISNIRIISHDVVEVLRDMIANNSFDRVMVYFPDPWPKARHHKRRLIQAAFVQALLPKMKLGGILHCATDWENYAQQMLEVLGSTPGLRNTAQSYALRPDTRPLTKFENRGLRLGHGVWDLIFEKCSQTDA
jgi:tRNA (guanine-N7-)-methyltransferase